MGNQDRRGYSTDKQKSINTALKNKAKTECIDRSNESKRQILSRTLVIAKLIK